MAAEQKIVSTDTPLGKIRDVFTFFHTPANVVQIQVASDKTLYAWQNMSGFQYTMQIPRDGPISDLPVKIDPAIGKIAFTDWGRPRVSWRDSEDQQAAMMRKTT